MPIENEYSLQDLADLTDVTPRTIRYYIAQGLLPSPEGAGPGARYGEGHLARLRLIRQLQREHLPLAEIRARLAGLDEDAVSELLSARPATAARESAVDYIRTILAGPLPAASPSITLKRTQMLARPRLMHESPGEEGPPLVLADEAPAVSSGPAPQAPAPDRSQWDRISLAPDIELHIRRPLSRIQNKRVDRLIAIARQVLQEEPS